MHDVLLQLKWAAGNVSQTGVPVPALPRGRNREPVMWISATAVLSLVVLSLVVALLGQKPPEALPVRFLIDPPNKISFARGSVQAPRWCLPMANVLPSVEDGMKAGYRLATEGCLPSALGARVRLSNGKSTVTDGPSPKRRRWSAASRSSARNRRQGRSSW